MFHGLALQLKPSADIEVTEEDLESTQELEKRFIEFELLPEMEHTAEPGAYTILAKKLY